MWAGGENRKAMALLWNKQRQQADDDGSTVATSESYYVLIVLRTVANELTRVQYSGVGSIDDRSYCA